MIEFTGNLSKELKRNIQINASKTAFLSCIIISIMLTPLIVYMALLLKSYLVYLFYIVIFVMIIFVSIPSLNSPIKILNLYLPEKIVVEENNIFFESQKYTFKKPFNDIKRVIDKGKWYQIIFISGQKSKYCYCQKDLIKKGTIEDFEALFADKIVRKIK